MQDVTTLAFMQVVARYGVPDYYVTEYFRVHAVSQPEPHIVDSILRHGTGRPVFAQLIGESLPDLRRTVAALTRLPIAGIDLNLGCPAPKIYRKNVGGGLLRDPARVDSILACLRDAVGSGLLTVKMRLGFEDTRHFTTLLGICRTHRVDLVTVHGRTVLGGYRAEVDYDQIALAVRALPCPVIANGNILSAARASAVLEHTGAAGVMIGRHAIRNPWIFRQCRELFSGRPVFQPTLADVRGYIDDLFSATDEPGLPERVHLGRLKKFLNFIGLAVDPDGEFLYTMRRARTRPELHATCDRFLLHSGRAALPFPSEPYPGLVARPNCEVPHPASPDPLPDSDPVFADSCA